MNSTVFQNVTKQVNQIQFKRFLSKGENRNPFKSILNFY